MLPTETVNISLFSQLVTYVTRYLRKRGKPGLVAFEGTMYNSKVGLVLSLWPEALGSILALVGFSFCKWRLVCFEFKSQKCGVYR